MDAKEVDPIYSNHYKHESPLLQLRLLNSLSGAEFEFECGLSSDHIEVDSSLKEEFAKRRFYFFFGDRLSYSSISLLSLIFPSVGREITDSEQSLLGYAADKTPPPTTVGSGAHRAQFYSGSHSYLCTLSIFEDYHTFKPNDIYTVYTSMSRVFDGKNIYMIGGLQGYHGADPVYSTRALRFTNIAGPLISPDPLSYQLSEMNSVKGDSPIALEHKGFLYVLANYDWDEIDCTFESYDIEKNKWEILNPPPIHWSCDIRRLFRIIYSYAARDDKIYVSTKRDAYVYDISTKEWHPCSLFSKGKFFVSTPDSELDLELKGGPAFEFDGEGIFFENKFLICLSIYGGRVLAYFFDSDKVHGVQKLCYLPELTMLSHYSNDDGVKLVDLGNGYFCVTYNVESYERILVLVVFHISQRVEPYDGEPLSCRICCRHEIELASVNDWNEAFCFSM